MGRYLVEAVQLFGKRFDEVKQNLYQGIIGYFKYNLFAPSTNYPKLCNTDKNIAVKWASKTNGCTLTIQPKYQGEIDNTKIFPLNQWKDTAKGGWYGVFDW